MSGTARGEHPSVEELDEVLDAGDREVSAAGDAARHVEQCPRCRQAVADLSEVRSLLRAEAAHVPPPPEDLDDRIAAALAVASRGEGEDRRAAEVDRARPSTATVVPLRQRPRVPRWVAAAAGLLVLGGAGLTAGQLLDGGDGVVAGTAAQDAGAAPESAEAGAGAASAAAVLATGTDYGPQDLDEQVGALLDTTEDGDLGGGDSGGGGEEEAGAPLGAASEPDVRLSDPADLGACLQALGADPTSAAVVDLATWQGQEVAVIVLDEGPRHTVWVVERSCRPGADGLVHYQVLTS